MKHAQQARGASRAFDGIRSGSGPGFGAGLRSSFGAAMTGSPLSYLAEPPSFAAVADPNVVVSLKNVLKKDTTTKTKALEDLLHHARAHPFDHDGGVDEALLDIWAQLYPRISIDNARRVRELSHTLQFELIKSARRRIERYIPRLVGAWLAGPYDRDRAVARAASDGLSSFLNTPDKMAAFWSRCRPQILAYAIDAVQETKDTLSDPRSTTPEDAEAKYYRVVAASLSLVLHLLQMDDAAAVEKSRHELDAFFAEEAVWKSITFKDPHVRRIACQLVLECLERRLPYADSANSRQLFVTGGLRTNQSGSALEYLRALTKLTQRDPSVWAAYPNDKKFPLSRLHAFVAKGSQGSPPTFWECLDQLLASLPADLLTLEAASSLLSSLKSGITSREEPRTNTSFSWKRFVDAAKRCLDALADDDRVALAKEHLLPLLGQFLLSVSNKPRPIPHGPNAMSVLVDIHLGLLQSSPRLAEACADEWARLGAALCTDIAESLPETSKDYQASQTKIGEEGRRWFALVGLLHGKSQEFGSALLDQTTAPSTRAITKCITLLESRNLKPFGAAQALEYALSTASHLFTGETEQGLAAFLSSAAREDMAKLVGSASSGQLFSCLRILGTIPARQGDYRDVWQLWTRAALGLSSPVPQNSALTHLVSQEDAAPLAQKCPRLQEAVCSQARAAAAPEDDDADRSARGLLEAAIVHQALSHESSHRIANDMVALLASEPQHSESVLEVLETLARRQPELFAEHEAIRTDLVAQLLGLSEIGDISPRAARIRSLLNGHGEGTLPVVDIIQWSLERAGTQSLEISTLVEQARSAADTGVPWEDILPGTNMWMAELSPLLERPINPSLSITNPINGAVTLPTVGPGPRASESRLPRDQRGRSVPARMALYTCELLGAAPEAISLPRQFHVELLFLLCLSVQLASDQMTSRDHDALWAALKEPDDVGQAEELVTSSRSLLNKLTAAAAGWDEDAEHGMPGVIRGLVDLAMKEATALTPRAVYSARALSELLQVLTEAHGAPARLDEAFLKPDVLKARPDTALLAAGLLTGLADSLQSFKAASNFCNRLVSDIAGASPDSDKTRMMLVLVTLCAHMYEPGGLPVANNRIIFAVRQMTSWMDDADKLDAGVCADICRALGWLLPCMKDVYGGYWEKTLYFCVGLWERARQLSFAGALPFVHASLKLYRVLEGLQEPSDDLLDALGDFAADKASCLVELLKLPRGESSQPAEIVDAMLCREVAQMAAARIPEPTELFPLLASESRDIQTAAFGMLHKKMPAQQQQKSVNALLDKTDARLPDELLSLLLEPPTLDGFSDEALALFPTPVRGYLLAWKLVFDALAASSLKVRDDLAEHLKTGDHVGPLLDFLSDVLGHSAAHPLNLDKEGLGPRDIADYDVALADAEAGEKSMHWLLAHLYFLALKHVPGLFKAWFLGCRSKQTRLAVEAWTARYFSPLIIADTLDGVQAWAEAQEPAAGDERALLVRVSRTTREVTAGYEVDELQAAIVIRVPANYPVEGVSVAGLHRVAVSERKWQSWIMATQGVITFSNGSIIDGLVAFKRNVAGALRGQSECAICYSIIATDRRMPDKRCATCKNLFHRWCLYKWFQTSNQNTCPLCRNPIDYRGADTAKRRQSVYD